MSDSPTRRVKINMTHFLVVWDKHLSVPPSKIP
jgi:hypothetical protein